ncbi:MAG: hypothetical protein RL238_1488 [Actinomycetota bacterium]|jgi:hypothetical protein
MVTFPFIAGDPGESGIKEVPDWALAVAFLGACMFPFAALLALAGFLIDRRHR